MATVSFNVTNAVSLQLLALWAERNAGYDGPPLTNLQKGKQVIVQVMQSELHRLKMRQAMATITDDDTAMS